MQSTLRKIRLPTSKGVHAALTVRLVPNYENQLKIMAMTKQIENFSVYVYGASLHENTKMFANTACPKSNVPTLKLDFSSPRGPISIIFGGSTQLN